MIKDERKLMNGFGQEITDPNFLADNLHEYVDFDVAAVMIDPHWTRHLVHQELKRHHIYRSQILIVYDRELYARTDNCVNQGKKYFITKTEVERIRKYVQGRPKRKIIRCVYCQRAWWHCRKRPCETQLRKKPEYGKSIEVVSDLFDRFILRGTKPKREFIPINQKKERKARRDAERDDNQRDNEVDG